MSVILTGARLLHQLREEAHHGLCALPAVAFHIGELCGEEIVKVLRSDHVFGQPLLVLRGHRLVNEGLKLRAKPSLLGEGLSYRRIQEDETRIYNLIFF